jgi:hypothetical protein
MKIYTIRNKETHKLLGIKLNVADSGNIYYTFTEDAPQFLYTHLSKGFIERAISPNDIYDGTYLHPLWGMLPPENYEMVEYTTIDEK